MMVGIMQKLVARYAVSMLQVNEQLVNIESCLCQKRKLYAALLVAILKSDTVRTTLTDLVKKALKIG